MTMTVKLDPEMERELRNRSAALGVSASTVMREALAAWFVTHPLAGASAYELGEDLFGRHEGPGNLADARKDAFADVAQARHAKRGR